MTPAPDPALNLALARLEAWLENTRGPQGMHGYGGPVAHWWQQSLLYTGPGCDWRYEGIILGYLALWQRTNQVQWRERACRAAGDLVDAQLPDGHYPASAFEMNPASAGTPHEAACDLALLVLAQSLKRVGDVRWQAYAAAASRNLRAFHLARLWDPQSRSFRDHPRVPSFVPNKASTLCEALLAWSELSGEARWAEEYALPTLEKILDHQVREAGLLHGAIAQNSFGSRVVEKYLPYYIARCIPALVKGSAWFAQERFLVAALAAMGFILRWLNPDGSLPAAVYAGGQLNQHPQWVAALGDVLRAADLLRPHGFVADLSAMQSRLLAGQDASGGIQTATGFAAQAGGRPGPLPDFRDLLHVVGWVDKAFHYLSGQVIGEVVPQVSFQEYEAESIFLGKQVQIFETTTKLEAFWNNNLFYRWVKGEIWAQQTDFSFWLH